MNFCPYCGSPVEKNDLFCSNCGLHLETTIIRETDEIIYKPSDNNLNISDSKDVISAHKKPKKLKERKEIVKPRIILRAFYYFFAGLTVLSLFFGLIDGRSFLGDYMYVSFLFLVVTMIFRTLSLTPKEQKYVNIPGLKKHNITKVKFIFSGVLLALFLPILFTPLLPMSGTSNSKNDSLISDTNKNDDVISIENDDSIYELDHADIVAISRSKEEAVAISQSKEEADNISVPFEEDLLIIDAQKFSGVSSAKLIELLGEPDITEEGNFTGVIKVPCIWYTYDKVEQLESVDFALINDEVIHLVSYTDLDFPKNKELEAVGLDIPKEEVGILPTAPSALRLRTPTTNIDEIWYDNIKGDTFNFLKITYNLMYSEEWYLSPTIEEQSYVQIITKNVIEALLKAPSSAKFAKTQNWKYSKNPYYIAVQAYVDADNSFGASVRSDFTLFFNIDGQLKRVVFDGEEVYNEGYIPYADLIEDLVGA